MNGKLNKIIGGIGALATALILETSSQAISLLPDFCQNYEEKAQNIRTGYSMLHGRMWFTKEYDVIGNDDADVIEFYRIIGCTPKNKKCVVKLEPRYYGFDVNRDGMFDYFELLSDPRENGINGNEFWHNRKVIL